MEGLLGMLAGAFSEHDLALEHLRDATERSRELGLEPVVARTELNTARVLLARGGLGDTDEAQRLLATATETAQRIGMPRLLRELGELS
jgi:hypothetical protein